MVPSTLTRGIHADHKTGGEKKKRRRKKTETRVTARVLKQDPNT